jgi:hypothetical protein
MTVLLDKEILQWLEKEIVYDLQVIAWKFGNSAERSFVVSASGMLPSPAWEVSLRKAIPQGFNPSQLLLHLDLIYSGAPAPQVVVPFSVNYTEISGEGGGDYDSTLVLAPGHNSIQANFDEASSDSELNKSGAIIVAIPHINEIEKFKDSEFTNSNNVEQESTEIAGGGIVVGGLKTDSGSGIIVKIGRGAEDAGGFVSFLSDRGTYKKKLVKGLTWYTLGWPPRRHRGDLWLKVSHPRVSEITADIDTCVVAGAVTATLAGIAAIVAGGGGSVPAVVTAAFKAALIACLTAKGIGWASDLSVRLYLE